jgi:hypothetical protein
MTLKMEVAHLPEILVMVCQTTRHHIPEGRNHGNKYIEFSRAY